MMYSEMCNVYILYTNVNTVDKGRVQLKILVVLTTKAGPRPPLVKALIALIALSNY